MSRRTRRMGDKKAAARIPEAPAPPVGWTIASRSHDGCDGADLAWNPEEKPHNRGCDRCDGPACHGCVFDHARPPFAFEFHL